MPIQLTWKPNSKPPITNVANIGLELSGADTTLSPQTDGRVKLIEVAGKGSGKGAAEDTSERLIATFHGTFHSNAAAPSSRRITFEIFVGNLPPMSAFSADVLGFDPECLFGEDVFVCTFVNREFIIWLPFYVDSRSEGKFLEIQAVAEVGSGASVKELGRSMILNLGIKRTHIVDSTNTDSNNNPEVYTAHLIGNRIVTHEDYILFAGIRNAAKSTPTSIQLDNILLPIDPAGGSIRFAAYAAGSMKIILLLDLLAAIVPPDSFLTHSIGGKFVPAKVRTDAATHLKNAIKPALVDIFVDAGFTGVQVLWEDEPAASTLVAAFKRSFKPGSSGGSSWALADSDAPFVTSFWNFFIGSGEDIQTAGLGEALGGTATPHTIAGKSVFLQNAIPIGGGDKSLSEIIRIKISVFEDLLRETEPGTPRSYKTLADFNDAVDKLARKLTIVFAHEVAHSLGMTHHSLVVNSGHYSEDAGSPILAIMSSGVESGGFGVGLKFSSQSKVIWAAAFGVSPTFDDKILHNKTWTQAEVFKMEWSERKAKFNRANGEVSLARPYLATSAPGTQDPPVFAGKPPAVQLGTFVP
jgi:hypothetical protein